MAGLAAAIRLSALGYEVLVFEKNSYPGGKLSELVIGPYRFDKGPSLFTMPEMILELGELIANKQAFDFVKLETLCKYFYEDGTQVCAYADQDKFEKEIEINLKEDKAKVKNHFKQSKFFYESTADLFLNQSLHQFKNFLNLKTLRGIKNSFRLKLLSTMHSENAKQFQNEKTIQLFDRYATYNGSNPYKAPALLNLIPHLEFGFGAYFPVNGMNQITTYLYELAKSSGVKFYFEHSVQKIEILNNKVVGLISKDKLFASEIVMSDADITPVYEKLIDKKFKSRRILNQEKSSSAFVFYWGIKKTFKNLDLHNILFSDNYKEEFEYLFGANEPYFDPTIYVNITSKYKKDDAPEGCENWFVMVNVPHNKNRTEVTYQKTLRKNVIDKINRVLKTNIEDFIEVESVLSPMDIELQTSSFGGSLYGNSSNNKFSAFLRHSNYSSKIKGMYFVGGSVHPGGGIPLCLLSAKIATKIISEKQ